MFRRSYLQAMLGGVVLALPHRAAAADGRLLTMGVTTPPTSLDPHYYDSYTSTQALLQIYSQLRVQDPTGALVPGLATTCTPLDDTTWELVLREGVTFHDGTPFEAEDIGFTFNRVRTLSPTLSSFAPDVRDVTAIDIISPTRVRMRLKAPDPLFEYKLGQVCMLSRRIHANATTADFTSGRLAIGTGAYKLVRYDIGTRLELAANTAFWGRRPDWDKVSIRYITDAGSRMAALLSGDVDMIDDVPVQEVPVLKSTAGLGLFSTPSFLTIYLAPDTARAQTPFVTGNDGAALAHNPLADARVRLALSLSINRDALVERLMLGQGVVCDQMVGPAARDRASGLPKLRYDPEQARHLLAEAGYPEGFRLTIHGTAGYFTNDIAVLQAVGQFFTRIGVRTEVETLPTAAYSTKIKKREVSLYIGAFNGAFALIELRYQAMTPDAAAGNGSTNRLMYSNPGIDVAMRTALLTMDAAKRHALTDQAMKLLMTDMGYIPLYSGVNNWAGRLSRVRYEANPMGRTSAFMARPAA